jgi:arylsulfatase A-like enzyme
MKRRDFLGVAAAGAAAAIVRGTGPAVAAESPGAAGAKRPNILFLLSDDQRYDTIHALGNDLIRTPNLDALAAAGTAFTNPYIMGGTGGAICVCTRSMVMTGRTIWHAPDNCGDFALWPQVFGRAGYTTFGTGKWHNGPASYARAFSRGGNIFFGGMSNHLKVPVYDFDPTGKYPKGAAHEGGKFSSELFSDTAVRFLREYKEEKPFFLYVAYTAPHDPRMPPEKFAAMYQPEKMPVPKNFMPEHPFENGELKVRDEMLAPHPRTPEVVQKHLADYYGMISHLDEQVGRVLAALEESGRARDTIVIFAGDNGLALGQHGLFGKQSVYEHSVRVPFLMRGPGVPAGERRDAFVYLLDLFPTVCEMTGVAAPDTVEGRSLVPVLKDKSGRVRETVFAAYRGLQRMVRDERFKLITYSVKGEKRTQLFDLVEDPLEMKDLSADPAYAKQRASLDARLREWQKQTGDPQVV